MLDIFTSIFDSLFPPHKSIILLRKVTQERFTALLKPRLVGKIIALCNYDEPLIKAAITANKFHDSKKAALLLGTLFTEWIKSQGLEETLFVPIPLSSERNKERGYNQVERILKYTPSTLPCTYPLLKRTTNTKPQTSLPRKERLENVRGIFSIAEYADIQKYTKIVVVDDVTTTGATLEEALSTLKETYGHTHEIIGVAIAH